MDLDYLGSIERDSAGFAEAVADAGPDKQVLGCPGWTVRDLAAHLHEVHDFWRTIVERRLQDPSEVPEELDQPEDFGELLGAFRKGAAGLVASLRGPTRASRSGPGHLRRTLPSSAAIRPRRRRCTAGMRRQRRGGFAIDPAIAADAVDEFLEFSTPSGRMTHFSLMARSTCTPPMPMASGWCPKRDDGSLAIERDTARATPRCATASDLVLILYRRVRPRRGRDLRGPGRPGATGGPNRFELTDLT